MSLAKCREIKADRLRGRFVSRWWAFSVGRDRDQVTHFMAICLLVMEIEKRRSLPMPMYLVEVVDVVAPTIVVILRKTSSLEGEELINLQEGVWLFLATRRTMLHFLPTHGMEGVLLCDFNLSLLLKHDLLPRFLGELASATRGPLDLGIIVDSFEEGAWVEWSLLRRHFHHSVFLFVSHRSLGLRVRVTVSFSP